MWEIRKSPVEGLGVFATVRIPAGTRLFDYIGEEMKWKDFTAKYGPYKDNSQYTYAMRRAWKIIVAKEEPYYSRNMVNRINEGPPNVVLRRRVLHSTRDIEPGEELFLQYPKDYNRFWLRPHTS